MLDSAAVSNPNKKNYPYCLYLHVQVIVTHVILKYISMYFVNKSINVLFSWLPFFQFYGYLSQQQNMMQDYVRTGTYQRAILQNHTDFKDKVVLHLSIKFGFWPQL